MASTGSSLDADQEGINPEINPIMAETTMPRTIFQNVSISWKLTSELAK